MLFYWLLMPYLFLYLFGSQILRALPSPDYIFQETHRKLIDVAHNDVKEVEVSELIKVSYLSHPLLH